jgi:hypothetical protein
MMRNLIFCAFATSLFGCGTDPHLLAPVSGNVTLDGKPLAGALVSFIPAAKPGQTAAVTSRGVTDQRGTYTLTTSDDRPGAVIGRHLVHVSTRRAAAAGSGEVLEGQAVTQSAERVPAKYNIRTELSFEVPAEGTDQADFQLQSR